MCSSDLVVEFVVNVPSVNPVSLMFLKTDVVVSVTTQVGYTYQLQTSSNWASGSWTNVGAAASGTGGLLALAHSNGATALQRFYRVLIAL